MVRQDLETNPESADAHYLLGYILFREGKPKTLASGVQRRLPAIGRPARWTWK